MSTNAKPKYIVRRIEKPTDAEVSAATDTMFKAFHEDFVTPVQNNDKDLSKNVVAGFVESTVQEGELWVAQLTEADPDKPGYIVGVALWFGRNQSMPRGEHKLNLPFEQSLEKLDVGQPVKDFRGKMKSKGHIWWDKFFEASDVMTTSGLGPGTKKAGYHLMLFGVHPDYQRLGIGSAMDKAVEDVIKQTSKKGESTVMCLEALGDENILVYDKMGYATVSNMIFPEKDTDKEELLTIMEPLLFTCMKKEIVA